MSNTDTSSLISPSYCRRNLVPAASTQVYTTVLTSSVNSSAPTVSTAVYKGLPQQQVSLPSSTGTPVTAHLSKSSSCPDSPIRRVSSSLRNSAVGFATRFFNKCRAATFTVDGATYTIVASTPENLPKRDDLSCSGGNNPSTGCHTQLTGSSANSIQQQYSTSDKAAFTNTQSVITAGGGGGGTGTGTGTSAAGYSGSGSESKQEFFNVTSPSGVDSAPESVCSNISITSNSSVSAINGQVARHGALTIVRRSNSRKSFSQHDSQHLFSTVTTSTPATSIQHSLLVDLTSKSPLGQSSHDNRADDFSQHNITTLSPLSNTSQPSSATSNTTKFFSNNNSTTTAAQNIIKMLPSSPNSINNSLVSGDDMETTREDLVPCASSASTITSCTVDLATENLPAVDTPDACDKAALRLRSLLHMLNAGEIQADVLQKNLHYAARVLEAVFLDESKDGSTSGKSKLRQNSCSSVECEDCKQINEFNEFRLGQDNKRETKDERCNSGCKNIDCSQHEDTVHSPNASVTNQNNNINTTDDRAHSGEEFDTQAQRASNNQISVESRTKGVCSAPKTHSSPTIPPKDKNNLPDEHLTEDDEAHKQTSNSTTTCSSSNPTAPDNVSNSSVSSSSCSNKATIQRQKRLRIPVWARSLSTNKTNLFRN